jgi:hypothetical protein
MPDLLRASRFPAAKRRGTRWRIELALAEILDDLRSPVIASAGQTE